MSERPRITSPDDPNLDALCAELSARADTLDRTSAWPGEQLRLCGQYGVYEWFMPHDWGGQAWSERDVVCGYLKLSAACLTTTFIITQRTGACERIVYGENEPLKKKLLPDLTRGTTLATVGISHLTTSRRHLARPVLRAFPQGAELVLDGYTPWVTGAAHAQTLVVGATLDGAAGEEQRQVLVALPANMPGVCVSEPAHLVGLSASHTGPVRLERVAIGHDQVVAGPSEQVMARGKGAGTGGLQTSTLAVGLAAAALEYLKDEAVRRHDLDEPTAQLVAEHAAVKFDLLALAEGSDCCSPDQLRTRANSLVLRASQAALAAAKGSGYVVGHPAGRSCREALFFLVWSCPQSVVAANLCELAGIEG